MLHGALVIDDGPRIPLWVADSARERTKGLLGRDGIDGALLLKPANSVHTLRMQFAIDVAFIDRDNRVIDVVTMVPNRFGRPRLRSKAVLEAEAGCFTQWGLSVGSVLDMVDLQEKT